MPKQLNDNPSQYYQTITLYSSSWLYHIAKSACLRLKENNEISDCDGDQDDALIAIVFSVAALEGFINELADQAKNQILENERVNRAIQEKRQDEPKEAFPIPDWIRLLDSSVHEAESAHFSTWKKFDLAHIALTGAPINKGMGIFQNFSLLIGLRNAIIHLKPKDKYNLTSAGDVKPLDRPKIIEDLRSKKILAQDDDTKPTRWLDLVTTRAAARWACNTAAKMVLLILEQIPADTHLRFRVEIYYEQLFQPVA